MPKRSKLLEPELQEALADHLNSLLGIQVNLHSSLYGEDFVAVKLKCGMHYRVLTFRTAFKRDGLVCKVCTGKGSMLSDKPDSMSKLQQSIHKQVIDTNQWLKSLPYVLESCTVPNWSHPVDVTFLSPVKLQVQVDGNPHFVDIDQKRRDADFNRAACNAGHCVARVHFKQLDGTVHQCGLAASLQAAIEWCQAHPDQRVVLLSLFCDEPYVLWHATQLQCSYSKSLVAGWWTLTRKPAFFLPCLSL